ncbi:MAG: alpha-D-ribose 1-methylphosphonate 5-triphosphate diphosphatase [Pseudomonadota bacterium]
MENSQLALTCTNADVLRGGAFDNRPLGMANGLITEGSNGPVLNLAGYYVLPGIIDLHGDAFERHLFPRPTAPFSPEIGLRSTERELLANGITTAYLAQSWSWEGGFRSAEATENLMKAIADFRAQMIADMRVQVRFEYYLTDQGPALLAAAKQHGVDYIVFNNHLDEGLAMAEKNRDSLANWAAKNGRSADEHLALMREMKAREADVSRFVRQLGEKLAANDIESGSHDDDDANTRRTFHEANARICEFPTSFEAAQAAKDLGNPILMGAPNVVRGGSQSGNIAATDLIDSDICDALVSDYYAPALASAAWVLFDEGRKSLSDAWAMISSNAARARGLDDRGTLDLGKRADVVILHKDTRQIEGTIAMGRIGHATGEFAARLLNAHISPREAAA